MTSSSQIGKTCPYCLTPIKPHDRIHVCDRCGMPHHAECWNENNGCSVYGCKHVTATAGLRPNQGTINVRLDDRRATEEVENSPLTVSGARRVFGSWVVGTLLGILFAFIPMMFSSGTDRVHENLEMLIFFVFGFSLGKDMYRRWLEEKRL
jgi:hypothetical protein